jgi:hypothetical protein
MENKIMTTHIDQLKLRATALKLHGMVTHWEEINSAPWVESLITWEEIERSQRSLERRLGSARLKRFKMLANFDWSWPKKCDREAIEELMRKRSTNPIF